MGKVKICPMCGHDEISFKGTLAPALGKFPEQHCEKCGFSGNFIEIDEEDVEKYRKDNNLD